MGEFMFKKVAAAAVATALVAAPVAANPATALSLSADVRAGESLQGENDLFGGVLGTLVSIGGAILSIVLISELIDDAEDAVSA